LRQLSCSGCHQARAIAGFHFPGADRAETPVSNAVYLPGSPHFYGDQVRRIVILERLAAGDRLNRYQLAMSYASRPLNKFRPQMSGTQLIGGWGGACLLPEQRKAGRRQWDCLPGLTCATLFESPNAPGMGTCLPEGRRATLAQGKKNAARLGQTIVFIDESGLSERPTGVEPGRPAATPRSSSSISTGKPSRRSRG
jgi:hypothetical protein